MKDKLTAIYYTSNELDVKNPTFLANTRKQLVKAIKDIPLVVVSFVPVSKDSFPGYSGEYTNLVAGRDFKLYREGRHHFNIYWQMLVGAKVAKTPYVVMVEDDILYSESHFYSGELKKLIEINHQAMLYDMSKVSLFTWTQPPMFSFRSKRMVVNQLIAPTQMFVKALTERFERIEYLLSHGRDEEWIKHYFGDLGRYESTLGVTIQPTYEWYSQSPSIVFSHPEAFGYLTQGSRKRLGDLKIIELYDWGRAEDVMKLWGDSRIK